MQNKFVGLPRNTKRLIVLCVDLITLPFAFWVSMSLRLGEFFVPSGFREAVIYFFFIGPLIAIPIFTQLGLYRAIIRYVGLVAMWTVIKGVTLYSMAFGVVILLSGIPGVPRSVLLINWLVTCLLVGGTRLIGRWILSGSPKTSAFNVAKRRVAIYGAGKAGIQTSMALSGSPFYLPVAFIDDNKALQGNLIEGIRVYSFTQLPVIIERYSITDVVIAMPSAARSLRSQIIQRLEPYSVHVSTLPGLDDIASGKVKVDDVREVGVLDLLGRIPVDPDSCLLNANVRDRVVLVTGAGGSIGSELCRQILKIKPKKLVLYERGEHDLYTIEDELVDIASRIFPDDTAYRDRVVPILGSVLDQSRLKSVCLAFGVETIYHAAAYKHVPIVERNPSEAVRNNIIGTYRAALAAIDSDVTTFVLISTDKAVRPTSTMGATKRFAEMILQGLSTRGDGKTRFTMVRFGNVLDSSGSVVPRFRAQIQKGGPITVTDPKVIRYFMTIPEAAQLVIQAGAMGQGGDVFVLDMGEPVKILDMARRMIHLSGFEVKDESNPEGEIEIIFTGLRPGEKLYEELLIGENVTPTQHALIMSAKEDSLPWDEVHKYLGELEKAVDSQDAARCRELLVGAVKGFNPQCGLADLVEEKKSPLIAGTSKSNIVNYPR